MKFNHGKQQFEAEGNFLFSLSMWKLQAGTDGTPRQKNRGGKMNEDAIDDLIKKTRAVVSFFDAIADQCEEAQIAGSENSMIGSLISHAEFARDEASECLDCLKQWKEEAEK